MTYHGRIGLRCISGGRYEPSAASYVEALVSGLPAGQREHQALMVLQAYFDDSGSSAGEPVYVLAGCLAGAERWAAFSTEWAQKLSDHGLPHFKMSEAQALKGPFSRGWEPSRRDKVVYELAEIVAKHAENRLDVSVRRYDFDDLLKGSV